MFERFSDTARQVVVLASDEARGLGHHSIGTKHILLALLRQEEGLAARVLDSVELTLDDVRAEIVRTVGRGDELTTGQIPFTRQAKDVLESALREALARKQSQVGPEHLLLGLLRVQSEVAVHVLLAREIAVDDVRALVLGVLDSDDPTFERDDPAKGRHIPFNPGTRKMLELAREEARTLKHTYVGTEHILLGLIGEQRGLAAGILISLGITREQLHARIAGFARTRGDEPKPGHIPFTPLAARALELAVREARTLSSRYVRTEHVLLGLVSEGTGVAVRLLLDLGVDAETIRAEVKRALAA